MALLLATTGVVAASIIGAEAAAENRRRRRWQRALAADPSLRVEFAALRMMEAQAPAWLLLVHIEGAQLDAKLAGKDLRVRLKLGEPGHSIRQRTEVARSEPDGQVFFGSTFAFPWNPLRIAPVVRVRLDKVRLIDSTLAKEEFWLPFGGGTSFQAAAQGEMEQDVLLFDRKRDFLGSLRVVCQLQAVSIGELHALGLLGDLPPYEVYGRHPAYGHHDHYSGYAQGPVHVTQPATIVAGHAVRPDNVVVGRPIQPGEQAAAAQGAVLGSTVAVTSSSAAEGGKFV